MLIKLVQIKKYEEGCLALEIGTRYYGCDYLKIHSKSFQTEYYPLANFGAGLEGDLEGAYNKRL